jgi:glycerophosphoryl diester phosphodiesterase
MMVKINYLAAAMAIACISCAGSGDDVAFPGDEAFDLECPGVTPHVARVPERIVVGHRGAAAIAVENTIESMKTAVEAGAAAVEVDLSMTKDGYVVLWHDWDPDDSIALGRQNGAERRVKYRPSVPSPGDEWRRPVHELTLAELRQHYGYEDNTTGERADATIPTFDELVEWSAKEARLSYVLLDIKVPEKLASMTYELVEKTSKTLESKNPKLTAVYLSPHPPVWEALDWSLGSQENLSFDVDPGAISYDGMDCDDASSRWATVRGGGYATNVRPMGWGNEDWKALKSLIQCDLEARDAVDSRVRKVFAATIDDPEMMDCLLDMGIDGMLTDDPARLRAIIAEKEAGRPARY